jgi:hypothetical protein
VTWEAKQKRRTSVSVIAIDQAFEAGVLHNPAGVYSVAMGAVLAVAIFPRKNECLEKP